MTERKTLYTRHSEDFADNYSCQTTLIELKEHVCVLINKFGENTTIEFNDGCVDVLIERLETDEEMTIRLTTEEIQKEIQRKRDLEQYEFYKNRLGL